MKIKFIIFLFFLIAIQLESREQLKIKVNYPAPEFGFTDYLKNEPKDKDFFYKYKVMEFWATWCAPCLAEVPHLNELQKKFSSIKDLVFFSITDEKTDIIKKTLNKIDFGTIVVSDQTKKTQNNFILEENNSMELPRTVLVDNKNIIRWIGLPNQLNEAILSKFLNNEKLTTDELNVNSIQNNENKYSPNPVNLVSLFKDNNIVNLYLIELVDSTVHGGVDLNAISVGKFLQSNKTLYTILSILNNTEECQITLPKELEQKKFSLAYINQAYFRPDSQYNLSNEIKLLVLKSLKLKEEKKLKDFDVFNLRIADSNQLIKSAEKEYETQHAGDNGTHLTFANVQLKDIASRLSKENNIIIKYNGVNNNRYNFLLKKATNIVELEVELNSYGLTLEKTRKQLEYFEYVK